VGGEERGFDAGKKVKGRKRNLLVDTQGLVLNSKVHAASVFDRDSIKPLMELVRDQFPRHSHLWLDAGYNGKGKGKDWVEKVLGLTLEVVRPPRRWVWVPEDQEPPWPGFHGPTEEMGGGEDVFLDRPKPQAEQGLREADGNERGEPNYIRSDNGPEFIAEAMKHWLAASGVKTLYTELGAPWENAYSETFISRLRDELLNREVFANLKEAKVLARDYRDHYNQQRPHGALGYLTPAEFAAIEALTRQSSVPSEELQSVPRLSS
jgi:putative transposase